MFESEPPNGDPSGNVNRKFNWKRPPAALFDPSKVSDRISTNGRYVVFEGNQYDSAGFLLKDFRINTVVRYHFPVACSFIEEKIWLRHFRAWG